MKDRPHWRALHEGEEPRPGTIPEERDGKRWVIDDDDEHDEHDDDHAGGESAAAADAAASVEDEQRPLKTRKRRSRKSSSPTPDAAGNGLHTESVDAAAPSDAAALWRDAVARLAAMGDEREVLLAEEAKRLKVRPSRLDKAVMKLLAEQAEAEAEAKPKIAQADPDLDTTDEPAETIEDAIERLASMDGLPYVAALKAAATKFKMTPSAIEQTVQQKREPHHPSASEDGVTLPRGFRLDETGLWFLPLPSQRNPDPRPVFICGPFTVLGQARDLESRAWGIAIEWFDHDRRRHIWSCPQRLVHLDGNEIAAELADAGLSCGTSKEAHELLKQFFGGLRTKHRLQSAERAGWHATMTSSGLVMPDGTINTSEEGGLCKNN